MSMIDLSKFFNLNKLLQEMITDQGKKAEQHFLRMMQREDKE